MASVLPGWINVMLAYFFKALAIWLLLVALAVLNGTIREKLLVPSLGKMMALPVSGIFLSLLIFLITLIVLPWFGQLRAVPYWVIGGIWLILTLTFEFVFGHYVMGNSWNEVFEAYNIAKGNLWVLVLLFTFISPFLAARIRGFI